VTTSTLSVIGYLDTFPKQAGLSLEQVKAVLKQHRELMPGRIQRVLAWAEHARPGESWQTDTDLRESDQADIYLTKA